MSEMKSLLAKKQAHEVDCQAALDAASKKVAEGAAERARLKGEREGVGLEAAALRRDRDDGARRAADVERDLSARLADSERRGAETADRAASAERHTVKLEGALHAAREELRRADARRPTDATSASEIDRALIRELRQKIRCSVCDDREKSTVLTRCMHAFCRQCIDTVIATRSRKCPACSKPFGAADVKDVYLVT